MNEDSDGFPFIPGSNLHHPDQDGGPHLHLYTLDLTLLPVSRNKPNQEYSGNAESVAQLFLDPGSERPWKMPGGFHADDSNGDDAMDLDHLPPFTLASDMYFDANTPAGDTGLAKASNGSRSTAPPSSSVNADLLATENLFSYGFQMAPDDTLNVFPELLVPIVSNEGGYSGYADAGRNIDVESELGELSAATPGFDDKSWSHDHRPLFLAGADLLPLTTTTSLTPLVSSVHSTQPSFFSAHQYFRSSFDAPRTSLDMYTRQRVSLDSQNSGIAAPVRNKSLASYLPFMGDRKLPTSPVGEWTESQNLRRLIRSIFKSNGDEKSEGFLSDLFSPALFEVEDEDEPPKKAKRAKRSLFTRFKGKQEEEDRPEDRGDEKNADRNDERNDERNDRIDDPSVYLKRQDSRSLAESDFGNATTNPFGTSNGSNAINAINESSGSSMSNGLNMSNGPNLSSGPNIPNGTNSATPLQNMGSPILDEPDYAALFHGVGKRRMKKKSKDGIKTEPVDDLEKLTLSVRKSQDNASARLGDSAPSQASSASAEGASFASASKRILGSRLLKRKASTKLVVPELDVVEIDLQLLDLPPNTEILSEINSKTRTRGRKEDKVADMEDQTKIFVCGYCSRRFKRQEHLKRHFRSLHTSEKPYECPICQKKFSRTDNLNQHLKVHKQEGDTCD